MKRTEATTFALLLVLCAASAQDNCGTIGNTDESDNPRDRRDRRFYLDTLNSASCTGNVVSWRVCLYYGPDDVEQDESISYSASYAVYRRMGSGRDERYERVSDAYRAVRTTSSLTSGDNSDGIVQQEGFACFDDDIDAGNNPPLTVQAGDVLGACVFDPQDGSDFTRLQLDIVGDTGRGSSESLLEMGTGGSICSTESLPLSIPTNDLSTRNSRRLHLHANIVPIVDQVTTTMATATDIATKNTVSESSTAEQPKIQESTIIFSNNQETTMDLNQGDIITNSEISLTSPNKTGSGGFPTEAIIGLIVGILVSLLLVVVTVLVVLYLVKRRQTEKGKYSSRRTDNKKTLQSLDSMTYGTGEESKMNRDSTKLNDVEGSLYEVPVKSKNGHTRSENEMTASTYAVPHVYECATWAPNEMDVSSQTYYSPLDSVTISYEKLLEKNKEEDIYGSVEKYLQPANGENELHDQIRECGIRNISSRFIQIQGHLGSGQFGLVEKGLWRDGAKSVPVAVKLLKEGSSETDKVKFLQEAAIMAQFRHPNVVSLYGVVSNIEPFILQLMLVVELIQKGDLRNYLHTLRPDPGQLPLGSMPRLFLSFSQQVALRMHYLSSKGFVHRDLAARNILVSKYNMCKVVDFGMSRDLADEIYYVSQGGKIPVKWTAPEAIHYKKYSIASDVWSYGCLLYEIWSVGYKPYEGMGNVKVVRLVDYGKRLAPPPGCPRVIYELMIKCWNPVAGNRPVFREILLPLLSKADVVLSIPREALDTQHLAGVLGSSLEAGENMYTDLRDVYLEMDDDYQKMN